VDCWLGCWACCCCWACWSWSFGAGGCVGFLLEENADDARGNLVVDYGFVVFAYAVDTEFLVRSLMT